MPCRVGITTDMKARKRYWEDRVIGLEHWEFLARFDSQKEAKDYEYRTMARHCCNDSSPEGQQTSGPWFVYHFYYKRDIEKPLTANNPMGNESGEYDKPDLL